MHNIHASSVNVALSEGIFHLLASGEKEASRNGAVLVAPQPVTTTYYNPTQRVLFSPERDANPFFHLMESIWMLGGHNDVAFPAQFAKNISSYSDDGVTLWGAYGHRWRNWFGYDQLEWIIDELRTNPTSRRCVLSMWDPGQLEAAAGISVPGQREPIEGSGDLYVATHGGKDVPCNTHAYFDCRGGKLNMTVCNRSNDAVWGAYGANAVHFSVLLEFMALAVGIPVGMYRQVSNNLHAYLDAYPLDKLRRVAQDAEETDRYYAPLIKGANEHYPLVSTNAEVWLADAERFLSSDVWGSLIYTDRFFTEVAVPMRRAYVSWKAKDFFAAKFFAHEVRAWDWKLAAIEWLARREEKRNAK